ncbi:MAG TPA: ectonucleotide pyrophosphatase/phosphodiesterase [Patescibacteria group bacterium]|nr:ectonucleotide pyrophosphatase/phosphodiesterase [Patescibacteria group bacterium]
MSKLTNRLIVLSFDGLSSLDFEYIMTLPNFSAFVNNAAYCKQVYSIYPTLTYPAHTTIVTGKYPKNHGIINNTILQPGNENPDWYWHRKHIRGDTLFDMAIKEGMRTAALLWPVTAKSRIKYNMPEIFANRPWQNQILVSLLNGSPYYQYRMNQRFGYLRKGKKQPELDNFTHQSLLFTLKNHLPELSLVHYTDLDTMRHYNGFHSEVAFEALQRHDIRLGEIIAALKEIGIYEDSTIVVLGDHSSLDEDKIINLNVLFKEKGWILKGKNQQITYNVICKNCDGSAYIYLKGNQNEQLKSEVYTVIEHFNSQYSCIEAIHTAEEAAGLGADPNCVFMLEAQKGYYFLDALEGPIIRQIQPGEAGNVPHITINTHGYSPFKEEYTTVFMASGKGIKKGAVIEKMNLIDEGPTMARLLGLELKEADGKVLNELLDV